MTINSLAHIPNRTLIDAAVRAAADTRRSVVDLLMLLGEIDARRLYLGDGFASLFAYCTHTLHFSEHEAYHRIEAARAVRAFPIILDRLREGALTLTSVTLLRPHLTTENSEALIAEAHEVPAPKPSVAMQPLTPPSPRSVSQPLSSDRYLLRVTLTADAHAALQRARDLLRHSVPDGDPAAIVGRALNLLVEDLERRRTGKGSDHHREHRAPLSRPQSI